MKYINFGCFLSMILVNFLANFLPVGGRSTGEISSMYPNLFTPAGFVFTIWILIYVLLFIFSISPFFRGNSRFMEPVGWGFALSCMLNIAWIFAWHHLVIWLSLILMAGLLVTLAFINMKLKAFSFSISKAAFGIYLGWISIATVANTTVFMVSIGWGGLGMSDVFWAATMVLAGALITTWLMTRLNNIFIALPVVWAFAGIFYLRIHDFIAVAIAASAGILMVLTVSGITLLKQLKTQDI